MISLVLDNSTFAKIQASVFPSTPELQSKPVRVVFPNANPDVQKSIAIAESLATEYLHHVSKVAFPVTIQVSLDFGGQAETDFNGQSAAIAFFLALTEKICQVDLGNIAATGALTADGALDSILGLEEKLEGILDDDLVPDIFVLPESNLADITTTLAARLKQRKIQLLSDKHITALLPRILGTWVSPEGNPYRGLGSFEFNDHDLLFGREQDKLDLLQRFHDQFDKVHRQQQRDRHLFMTVLGRSGAGKSSLVKAGLLPLLVYPQKRPENATNPMPGVATVCSAIIRPDDNSGHWQQTFADAFVDSLPSDSQDDRESARKDLVSALHESPSCAVELVQKTLSSVNPEESTGFVLVIDQFEQIFKPGITHDSKQALIDFLLELSRYHYHPTAVIIMLQSDYLEAVEDFPELLQVIKAHGKGTQHHVQQLDANSPWFDLVRKPAQLKGYEFEQRPDGSSLADEIRDDILELLQQYGNRFNVLPWLQFALTWLYEQAARRESNNKLFMFDDYHQGLGGLKGTLSSRAESLYQELSPEAQDAFDDMLDQLVRYDSRNRQLVVTRISVNDIRASAALDEIASTFTAGGLFTREPEGNGDTIALAHHALLETDNPFAWERIREWRKQANDRLEQADRVETRYQQYSAAPETARNDHLLTGSLVNDALEYRQHYKNIPEDLQYFIDASLQQHRHRRRISKAIRIATVGLLIAGSVFFIGSVKRDYVNWLVTDAGIHSKRNPALATALLDRACRLDCNPRVVAAMIRYQATLARRKTSPGNTSDQHQNGIVISENEQYLVEFNARTVLLREPGSENILQKFTLPGLTGSAITSANGRYIMFLSIDHLYIYDTKQKRLAGSVPVQRSARFRAQLNRINFLLQRTADTPNGLPGLQAGTAVMTRKHRQLKRKRQLLIAGSGPLLPGAVLISPNEKIMLVLPPLADHPARVYRLPGLTRISATDTVRGSATVFATFSTDGRFFTLQTNEQLNIYHADTGKLADSSPRVPGSLRSGTPHVFLRNQSSIAFINGDHLVIRNYQKRVTLKRIGLKIARHEKIKLLKMTSGSNRLLAVGHNVAIAIDAATGRIMNRIGPGTTNKSGSTRPKATGYSFAGFLPDGKRAYSLFGKQLLIWNTGTGRTVSLLDHPQNVIHATVSRNRKYIVAFTPNRGYIWHTKSGKRLATLNLSAGIRTARFITSLDQLLLQTNEGDIRVFELSPARLRARFQQIQTAARNESLLSGEGYNSLSYRISSLF